MKKVIALLLALVMTFSISTVAFVAFAEEPAGTEETTIENPFKDMSEEEIMNYIMNMDLHEAKFILKVAKIAIKLALVLDKLGFIDLSPIKNAILDAVWGIIEGYVNPEAPAAA